MIKKGFTLQETLITLGIIGIVAALTIPTMVKLKPNETKTRYLKAYNAIARITDDIISDDALYWQTYNDGNADQTKLGEAECSGLSCKGVPINGSIPDATRSSIKSHPDTKYARLVASRMHLAGDIACSGSNICTFTTTDGIEWSINPASFPYKVTINTDTKTASRKCLYSSTCKNPAQFIFDVSEDGGVKAAEADALGQAFLKNPTEMNDKSADLEEAKTIYSTSKPKT